MVPFESDEGRLSHCALTLRVWKGGFIGRRRISGQEQRLTGARGRLCIYILTSSTPVAQMRPPFYCSYASVRALRTTFRMVMVGKEFQFGLGIK